MRKVMDVTELAQAKAMLHPLRSQILMQLARAPATPSEVGRRIGIPANKAHYHVHVLEQAGLVELVETRQIGSITEKYYQAAAENFHLPSSLFDGPEGARRLGDVLSTELKALIADLQRLSASGRPADGQIRGMVRLAQLQAAPGDLSDVEQAAQHLVEKFKAASEHHPGRRYRLVVALVPMEDGDGKEPDR